MSDGTALDIPTTVGAAAAHTDGNNQTINPLDADPRWPHLCALLDHMSKTADPADRRALYVHFVKVGNQIAAAMAQQSISETTRVAAGVQFARHVGWHLPVILDVLTGIAGNDSVGAKMQRTARQSLAAAEDVAALMGLTPAHVVSCPVTVQ